MEKWMLLLSLVLMIVIVNCGQAQAAEETATKDITFEELNDENVFIKQSRRGTWYTGVFGHDYAQGGNAGRF